jgi:hypothetical protein
MGGRHVYSHLLGQTYVHDRFVRLYKRIPSFVCLINTTARLSFLLRAAEPVAMTECGI